LVVFTSGSTGKPKGVLIPQKAVVSSVGAACGFLEENDVFLSLLPFAFVAIVFTVLAPIARGATLHIADDNLRKDVKSIADYVKEKRITAAHFSPAMAAGFLQIADGCLRCLFTGSERVRNIFSEKTKCFCCYGASETSMLVGCFPIDKPYDNTPLGYATPGSRFYLIDADGRQVQDGQKGEICVSGQVGLGYLNLPDLTAERFTPNPFTTDADHRILFHTRDIGRFLPNGALEYIERKDWMLKVRGFRVEPGEIETVMFKSAPLSGAVVVGFTDNSGEQKLYACYTAFEPVPPSLVRERIALHLPEYMLPAFLEQVASLPLNANGKIDRSKIAPPDIAKYQAEYAAPTNESERALCEAFEEALGLTRVGIDDDFLKLGGDSLAALNVQMRLPEAMQMSAAAITTLRTPKEIAAKGTVDTIPIATDRKEWPVTYPEGVFLQEQKNNPTTSFLNLNTAVSLSGPLDIDKLEKSLRVLLQKHRVLRSVYRQDSSGQFIRKLAEIPECILQRVLCPEGKIIGEINARNLPFDIGGACPLYRFSLFEIDPENHVLHLCVFHSLLDGPGIQIFFEELAALYSGKITGLEQMTTDFLDFLDYAVWRDSNPKAALDNKFYRLMLAGALENNIPMKVPSPPPTAKCDGIFQRTLDLDIVEKAAKKYTVSIFTLFVGALGLTLGKYSKSNDVVMRILMNPRFAYAALHNTLGMLADQLPIRLKWDKTQTLPDFIKRTDEMLREIQQHQACSGREWIKEYAKRSHYDWVVNYNREIAPPSFHGLQAELFPAPIRLVDWPSLSYVLPIFQQTKQNINITVFYPPQLFEASTLSGIMECFASLLQKMGQDTEGNLETTLAGVM
ncbi:MAG: AMP-binding protein, partial [Gracilibacteraceae bacterium]|nr:AMP-binding protein [Gracilibacteraceae bacterium]